MIGKVIHIKRESARAAAISDEHMTSSSFLVCVCVCVFG